MKNKFDKINNVSSDAVRAKTGKTWAEWIAILDQAGAKKMTHKEIVAYLRNRHTVSDWWQQMVTVGYEQARGLRKIHEKPEGFQISVSKTVDVPASQAYMLWADEKSRARFLPRKSFTVSKATRNKSIRAVWKDGKSRLNLDFYAKSKSKSQVTIQHSKLPNAHEAKQMKAYWAKVLDGFSRKLKTTPLD